MTKKEAPVSVLDAAEKVEQNRLKVGRSRNPFDEARREERQRHISGRPLMDAAIAATSFLGPFEFEVVDVQEVQDDYAPDWVVVRDLVSEVLIRVDLLDVVDLDLNTGNTTYPNSEDYYMLNVVVLRRGLFLKSKFRKHRGHQWKKVDAFCIMSLEDLRVSVGKFERIIQNRMAT